jgi:hypothetical protein
VSHPDLAHIRDCAIDCIVAVSRVGQLFSDTLVFDDTVMRLLAEIDHHGRCVLSNLRSSHPVMLLELYIDKESAASYQTKKKFGLLPSQKPDLEL